MIRLTFTPLVLAAGVDAALQRVGDPLDVIGVQSRVERLDALVEVVDVVAEHGDELVVPGQLAGEQIPVEGADPGVAGGVRRGRTRSRRELSRRRAPST